MRRRTTDPRRIPGLIGEIFDQVGLVWRLLWDKRVPITTKLVVPGVIVYVLSPIDLLPDFFAGVGQLDDLAIILIGLRLFVDLAPSWVVQEHLNNLHGFGTTHGDSASRSTSFVEGQYRIIDGQRQQD
jgi:uncharacterized membrane protein YkvA (DUF1232 family)